MPAPRQEMHRTARARRWRLAFPADGSAVFELLTTFDRDAVSALLPHLAELAAFEPRGLVLDLTGAGELDDRRRTLLVDAIGAAPRCPLAIVTPSATLLEGDLRAHAGGRDAIAVATAGEARGHLRRGVRLRPWRRVPAGVDRHASSDPSPARRRHRT